MGLFLPWGTFSLHANLIVRYPISQSSAPIPLQPDYIIDGVHATPLSISAALAIEQPDYGEQGHQKQISHVGKYWVSGWPQEAAIDQTKYIEFRLSPQSGYELSLEKMTFTLYSARKNSRLEGPITWDVYITLEEPLEPSNLSGSLWNAMGSHLASFFGLKGSSTTDTGLVYKKNMDLIHADSFFTASKISLRNLRRLNRILPGATVVVRFYAYGAKNGKGGFYHLGIDGTELEVYGATKQQEDCLSDFYDEKGLFNHKVAAYLVDGTWGHEQGGHSFKTISHIARIRKAFQGVDIHEVHYFRGVGNEQDYGLASHYINGLDGSGAFHIAENVYRKIIENYNKGITEIILVGWSRGAAIAMQVTDLVYQRGIPNKHQQGGYYVPARSDCIVIRQLHLLDTVHSIGLPNDINDGWQDKVIPPNTQLSIHYLANIDNPPLGFHQTRPPNAIEKLVCREMGVQPTHGDVGGSTGSPCSQLVYDILFDDINLLGKSYVVNATTPIDKINPSAIEVKIYSAKGPMVKVEKNTITLATEDDYLYDHWTDQIVFSDEETAV